MSALTTNLVLQRSRVDDMRYVKKLNACGLQLSDFSVLRDCPNLEICSLSVNSVDRLEWFAAFPRLRELYLRKNNVQDLGQVLHLSGLGGLECLTLSDNPVAELPHYRPFVVAALPRLARLDDCDVTAVERREAQDAFPDLPRMPPPPPLTPLTPQTTGDGLLSSSGAGVLRGGSRPSTPAGLGPTLSGRPASGGGGGHSAFGGVGLAATVSDLRSTAVKRPPVAAACPAFATGAGAASGNGAGARRVREDNIVFAVNTLLDELSPEGLRAVKEHLRSLGC